MNKKWIILVGFLMVVALLATQTSSVMAALRSCRTDPIVFLSDGTKVTLTSTIYTDPANIISVNYTLYVPKGVTLVNVIYTAGGLGGKETFVLVDNQPIDQYSAMTYVTLVKGSTVSVTTNMIFTKNQVYQSTSFSGQKILVEKTTSFLK